MIVAKLILLLNRKQFIVKRRLPMKPTHSSKEEMLDNQSNREQKPFFDEVQDAEDEIWTATFLLCFLSSVLLLLSAFCQLLSTIN